MPRLNHRHYHYHYGYNGMSLFVPVILILSLEKSINIETIIPQKNYDSRITYSLFVIFSCATKFSPIGQNLFLLGLRTSNNKRRGAANQWTDPEAMMRRDGGGGKEKRENDGTGESQEARASGKESSLFHQRQRESLQKS